MTELSFFPFLDISIIVCFFLHDIYSHFIMKIMIISPTLQNVQLRAYSIKQRNDWWLKLVFLLKV